MSIFHSKNEIIQRLKEHYGFSTNIQLAKKLGVAQNTISGWIKRNSIDYDLIFSKCEDVDFNWLMTGVGVSHKSYRSKEDSILDKQDLIMNLSQILKEDKAETVIKNYMHQHFNLEEYYTDDIYYEIDNIYEIVKAYSFDRLFSVIYNEYKKKLDINQFLASFSELYQRCFKVYLIISKYKRDMEELSSQLTSFYGEEHFKEILSRCEAESEEMDISSDSTATKN